MASAEQYWAFADTTISFEDVLVGKAKVKKTLTTLSNDIERTKLKEKLCVEAMGVLKDRKYVAAESAALRDLLVEMDSKERATAILQNIFLLKNNNHLSQPWIDDLLKDARITDLINHLMKKNNM